MNEHIRATQMYHNGQYMEALVLLDEIIAALPDWWYPISLKGQCNLKLGNFEDAVRNFNDALTLEVDSKDILRIKYSIAQAYMSMGAWAKAMHSYSDLLSLAPPSRIFEIYFNRGQAEIHFALAVEQDDRDKATSYYWKAVVSFSEALKQQAPNTELEVEARRQLAYVQDKVGNQ